MELLILKENLFSDQKQVAGKLAPSLLVASSALSFIHTLLKLHHLWIFYKKNYGFFYDHIYN